jgi:hypothetical protein
VASEGARPVEVVVERGLGLLGGERWEVRVRCRKKLFFLLYFYDFSLINLFLYYHFFSV